MFGLKGIEASEITLLRLASVRTTTRYKLTEKKILAHILSQKQLSAEDESLGNYLMDDYQWAYTKPESLSFLSKRDPNDKTYDSQYAELSRKILKQNGFDEKNLLWKDRPQQVLVDLPEKTQVLLQFTHLPLKQFHTDQPVLSIAWGGKKLKLFQ